MWQELEIKTTHGAYPAISNILDDFSAGGICKEELLAGENNKTTEISIKAYFNRLDITAQFSEIKNRVLALKDYGLEIGKVEFSLTEVKEEDWANNWKKNFKPFKATDKIVIKPTWEEYLPATEEIVIEIDPGRAFGTGQHETTTSTLRLLEKDLDSQLDLLDIGTGTGILAIAAAKLGANKITALDIDTIAVEIAAKNAALNGVGEKIEFLQGDLANKIEQKYDLVIANILPEVIKKLIPDLNRVCKDKGQVILSGIIKEKEAEIIKLLKEESFKVEDIIYKGEWITISALNSGGR